MQPDPIKRLMEYFMRLPGIGPRQASRFAHKLIDEDKRVIEGFQKALADLSALVGRCRECHKPIDKNWGDDICVSCKQGGLKAILVVEKDQDYETVSKSGVWQDSYHVLGGTVSLMNEKTRVTERIKTLYERTIRMYHFVGSLNIAIPGKC